MRKIIASAGLAALGAASVHAAYAPGLTPQEQAKPWTIGLALRGFYDDNYTTSPKGLKEESFGVSVSPSATVNKVMDQTLISLSYMYDLRWYADRESNEADHIQLAKLRVEHTFSEKYTLSVNDTFLFAQEGTVLLGPVTTPTVLMTDSDYVENVARVDFKAELTEQFGARVAYENQYWDFEQAGTASRSAYLDRMEHLATLEGMWNVRPETSGLLGYQYQVVDHRSEASLTVPPDAYVAPETRDYRAHRIYLGVEHQVTAKVNAGLRAGIQLTDYMNADDVPDLDDSQISPYVDGRATWTYNPGSFMQMGVVYTLNQTDVLALNQESVSIWATVNHRITSKMTGSLLAQFQHSAFNEGPYDGDADLLFLAGVNLNYKLNQYLSAEAGYNFDRLDSDLANRSYSRNRVYLGVRATY
jgi:hypothetical protein